MIWLVREEIENIVVLEFFGLRECFEIKMCDNFKVVVIFVEGNL